MNVIANVYKFVKTINATQYCFRTQSHSAPKYVCFNILDDTYYVCSSDWEQSHEWTNSVNLLMLVPDNENLYVSTDIERDYYFQSTVVVDHVVPAHSIAEAKAHLIEQYHSDHGVYLTDDELQFIGLQED